MFYLFLRLQYVEELTLLTMSELERSIYDMTAVWSPVEQRQICCHPQVVERLQKVSSDRLVQRDILKDVMITFSRQVITAPLYSTLCYWPCAFIVLHSHPLCLFSVVN